MSTSQDHVTVHAYIKWHINDDNRKNSVSFFDTTNEVRYRFYQTKHLTHALSYHCFKIDERVSEKGREEIVV